MTSKSKLEVKTREFGQKVIQNTHLYYSASNEETSIRSSVKNNRQRWFQTTSFHHIKVPPQTRSTPSRSGSATSKNGQVGGSPTVPFPEKSSVLVDLGKVVGVLCEIRSRPLPDVIVDENEDEEEEEENDFQVCDKAKHPGGLSMRLYQDDCMKCIFSVLTRILILSNSLRTLE